MHQLQYLIIKNVSYITIRQLTTLLSTSLANESLIMYAPTIRYPPPTPHPQKMSPSSGASRSRYSIIPLGSDLRLEKKERVDSNIDHCNTNRFIYRPIQDSIHCKQEQMVLVSQSSRASYCYCFNLITLIAPTFSPHNIILENSNKLKFHQHYLNRSINKGASIPMFTEKVF